MMIHGIHMQEQVKSIYNLIEVSRYNAGQTSNYGSDIFSFQNNIYRLFDGGVVPINEDLSPDSSEIIGTLNQSILHMPMVTIYILENQII